MRYIVDTNVIFSAIYKLESNAGKLLFMAIEGKVELYAPEYVKRELTGKLQIKLRFSDEEVHTIVTALPIKWIEDEIYRHMIEKANSMISDKKDVPILACALATGMDIITGDKDFHRLKYGQVAIWKLRDAVEEYE